MGAGPRVPYDGTNRPDGAATPSGTDNEGVALMANQLPSGRWRGRVRHPGTGKQSTAAAHRRADDLRDRRDAERAEDEHVTRCSAPPSAASPSASSGPTGRRPAVGAPRESTNLHNLERTRAFVDATATARSRPIDALDVAAWLKGGANVGTVAALRAMFNDARRPQAGMLVDRNPFAEPRAKQSQGPQGRPAARPGATARMIAAADELTPPSLRRLPADRLLVGGQARRARRAALERPRLRAETIRIERQWNAKVRKFTAPKHGSRRTIAMTEPVRERLLAAARVRVGVHHDPRARTTRRARNHHWNRVARRRPRERRLYLATRHFYGWYALNVLELRRT